MSVSDVPSRFVVVFMLALIYAVRPPVARHYHRLLYCQTLNIRKVFCPAMYKLLLGVCMCITRRPIVFYTAVGKVQFHLLYLKRVYQTCLNCYSSDATNSELYASRTRLRVGERAFSSAAPRLWNTLPTDIKRAATLLTLKKTQDLSFL